MENTSRIHVSSENHMLLKFFIQFCVLEALKLELTQNVLTVKLYNSNNKTTKCKILIFKKNMLLDFIDNNFIAIPIF